MIVLWRGEEWIRIEEWRKGNELREGGGVEQRSDRVEEWQSGGVVE